MPARRYRVAGRTFTKVAPHPADDLRGKKTHIVENGKFWKGSRSWEHVALCGKSITGVPTNLQRVNCPECRKVIEDLQKEKESGPAVDRSETSV